MYEEYSTVVFYKCVFVSICNRQDSIILLPV